MVKPFAAGKAPRKKERSLGLHSFMAVGDVLICYFLGAAMVVGPATGLIDLSMSPLD